MLYVAIGIVGARPHPLFAAAHGVSCPCMLSCCRTSDQSCAPTCWRRVEAARRSVRAESAQSCTCLRWSGPPAAAGGRLSMAGPRRRDGDAAQHPAALQPHPDAQLPAHHRGQAPGDSGASPPGRSLGRVACPRFAREAQAASRCRGTSHAALQQRGRTRVSRLHVERPVASVRRVCMRLARAVSHIVVGPLMLAWVMSSAEVAWYRTRSEQPQFCLPSLLAQAPAHIILHLSTHPRASPAPAALTPLRAGVAPVRHVGQLPVAHLCVLH
jgi:hypothetical protein